MALLLRRPSRFRRPTTSDPAVGDCLGAGGVRFDSLDDDTAIWREKAFRRGQERLRMAITAIEGEATFSVTHDAEGADIYAYEAVLAREPIKDFWRERGADLRRRRHWVRPAIGVGYGPLDFVQQWLGVVGVRHQGRRLASLRKGDQQSVIALVGALVPELTRLTFAADHET